MIDALAHRVVDWCRMLSACSEQPEVTTRTFLSPPMREVHDRLSEWMRDLGMRVSVDAVGNLRGVHGASGGKDGLEPRLFIGSHLDTVPNAGAFDGILGVVLGVALIELLKGRRFPFAIEVVGFSEEEGVRYGVPLIGSRALAGTVDAELLDRRDSQGVSVSDAIRAFGLDPTRLPEAVAHESALGFLEFHIEQGPVLESLDLPLGVVDTIIGQSRLAVTMEGEAAHAGTTPMSMRRDALTGMAAWIGAVEQYAGMTPGLVATVGRLDVLPGAGNVVPAECRATLDVRHADDRTRTGAVDALIIRANEIAAGRRLKMNVNRTIEQRSVVLTPALAGMLDRALADCHVPVHRMVSGAGHDAMVMAGRMPAAMLFIRTPGGVSHHPGERVHEQDVAAALRVGRRWLELIEQGYR